jgi:hypothetical protein
MEHELRVYAEVVGQPETCGVFLAVIGKFLAQSYQHAVEPPEHIGGVVNFSLEDGDSGHQDRGSFLIERRCDTGRTSFSKVAGYRCDTKTLESGGVLIMSDKLNQTARAGLQGLTGRSDNFEIDTSRGTRSDDIDFPGRRLTDSNLRLTHTRGFLSGRDGVANESRDFEFFCCLFGR